MAEVDLRFPIALGNPIDKDVLLPSQSFRCVYCERLRACEVLLMFTETYGLLAASKSVLQGSLKGYDDEQVGPGVSLPMRLTA